MKLISFKNIFLLTVFGFCLSLSSTAQDGSVIVNQDQDISTLLQLKKQINSEEKSTDRYKIQIYSGSRSGADNAENKYQSSYNSWSSKKVYETPNYKIWVGSFRTKLEADRALLKIQKKFPNAFKFQPPKD